MRIQRPQTAPREARAAGRRATALGVFFLWIGITCTFASENVSVGILSEWNDPELTPLRTVAVMDSAEICARARAPAQSGPPVEPARDLILRLPEAGDTECWLVGLARLGAALSEADTTYLVGDGMDLRISAESYAYLVKRAATTLRAADPNARVIIGRLAGNSEAWIREVLDRNVSPYVDGLAAAPSSVSGTIALRHSRAAAMTVWAIDTEDDEFGPDVVSRVARSLFRGADVSVVRPVRETDRLALRQLALILEDGFQTMAKPTVRFKEAGSSVLLELIGGTSGDVRAVLLPRQLRGRTLEAGGIPVERAELVELQTGSRAKLRIQSSRSVQRLKLPPIETSAVLLLYPPRDLELERVQVSTPRALSAEEIIAREQQSQARQRLELREYEAHATIDYHFTISNVNESIDVTLENDAFARHDAIEYRQRSFLLNGVPWKGKPPSLPFIAPEKIKEVPLRISLDEGYRYDLLGEERASGRHCYKIAFTPREPGSADFRGTIWVDRDEFFRVRIDLVRLTPSTPIDSDVMTQWFQPELTTVGTYWLMTRTEGQMLLSALGRSVILDRRVTFADFAANPPGFDQRRVEAHESGDPMFRDSPEEGLVALKPGPSGGERSVASATTKSNTLLMAGWGGSVDGDVRLPFAGFNWFDLDFRGTGAQVDLAWAGPAALLSVNWPLGDSPWQASFDAVVSGISSKDRHVDLNGRVPGTDLRRQHQLVEASFRRRMTPFLSLAVQPHLEYLRLTRNSDTDPGFLLPPDTWNAGLGMRVEYQRRGYELGLWARTDRRARWGPYGLPGDRSREESHDSPTTFGLQIGKSFYSRRQDRLSADLGFWGGHDLDRFSSFDPKFTPGLRIRGFDSKGLRFSRGVTGDISYALPPIGRARFELSVGGAVFEDSDLYGPGSEYAYGASFGVSFRGPAGTLLKTRLKYGIDSSLPIDGSDGSIRLTLFKTFDGWWPWARASRQRSTADAGLTE